MVRIEDSSGVVKIDYRKKTFASYGSWNQGKCLVNEVVDKILAVCT
jgi:hypothetical protein